MQWIVNKFAYRKYMCVISVILTNNFNLSISINDIEFIAINAIPEHNERKADNHCSFTKLNFV